MGMQQAFTPAEQVKLNLPVREALQSMRDGDGNDTHWNTLAAVVNVCLLRGERIAPEVTQCAKDGQLAVLSIKDRDATFHKLSVEAQRLNDITKNE
jgi:hypothetical protein